MAFALPVWAAAEVEVSVAAAAEDFNTSFLLNGGSGFNLGDFLQGNSILPGTYRVDINVNRSLTGRQDVRFDKDAKTGKVQPCLTREILVGLGIDPEALLSAGKLSEGHPQDCIDLPAVLDQSTVVYDSSRQKLDISVPQASMLRSARGFVDPALWDQGVIAAFSTYNANLRQTESNGRANDSYSVGLRNGLNLGPWRLRNEASLAGGKARTTTYQSNRTYAQRDITALKSQLALGTTYTASDTFDSVRLLGATLASDDGMLPDSQRGYAPVVRGYAQTNASVEVRQNGYLLHSANVSAGPFEFHDIYPSGSNGDLYITVIEADGRRSETVQTFASLPQMVRKGVLRYSLAAGRFDSNYEYLPSPMVVMGTAAYGLTDSSTVLSGSQWTEGFRAMNLGISQSTPVGGLSLDITQSESTAKVPRNVGKSISLKYAKTLSSTATTMTLANHRYSTEGYRTLSDHINDSHVIVPQNRGRAKSRFDLTVIQSLGDRKNGSLYLSSNMQRYWNLPGQSRSFNLSYSNGWGSLAYSIGVSHVVDPVLSSLDNPSRLSLNVSYPLGGGTRAARSRSSVSHDSNGYTQLRTGVSGQIASLDDAYYNVGASHDDVSGNADASINGVTSVARLNASISQGRDHRTVSLGANGSVVAHADGVNLGQPLNDGFSLAHIPTIQGVSLNNFVGVTSGRNGYAIVPASRPYRSHWISIDGRGLDSGVDIENMTQQVISRRGAVTLARFEARNGRRVQFELIRPDGSKFPFGASVETLDGRQLAVSDPNGRALVLVDETQAVLKVKSAGVVCDAAYTLGEKRGDQGYERVKLVCQ